MAFDAITPAKLGQSAIATTPTLTTVYTVPSLTRTFVKNIDVANTTAAPLTVNIYLVPSGGTAGTGNMLFPTVSIPANSIVQWTGSQILNTGDFIQATGSGAGLTINASGGEAI